MKKTDYLLESLNKKVEKIEKSTSRLARIGQKLAGALALISSLLIRIRKNDVNIPEDLTMYDLDSLISKVWRANKENYGYS